MHPPAPRTRHLASRLDQEAQAPQERPDHGPREAMIIILAGQSRYRTLYYQF